MSGHSSKITTIVGAQWGDEGKGKITDFFAGESDYVVRFHGGNNAGHTVIVDNKTYMSWKKLGLDIHINASKMILDIIEDYEFK